MPVQKQSKVIIDTNIWISFLIGKEIYGLADLIKNEKIKLIISDQLLTELKIVTSRKKLKKYFQQERVTELIALMEIIAKKIQIKNIEKVCRDPKDDFLLALAKQSKANFLITGDKDLLDLKSHYTTQIINVTSFNRIIGNI